LQGLRLVLICQSASENRRLREGGESSESGS
jgi:hypothetical protein